MELPVWQMRSWMTGTDMPEEVVTLVGVASAARTRFMAYASECFQTHFPPSFWMREDIHSSFVLEDDGRRVAVRVRNALRWHLCVVEMVPVRPVEYV